MTEKPSSQPTVAMQILDLQKQILALLQPPPAQDGTEAATGPTDATTMIIDLLKQIVQSQALTRELHETTVAFIMAAPGSRAALEAALRRKS